VILDTASLSGPVRGTMLFMHFIQIGALVVASSSTVSDAWDCSWDDDDDDDDDDDEGILCC